MSAEQGDAICIHCGAEVFWGLPLPEDPCFECGKPVAEQGDVEALAENSRHTHANLDFCIQERDRLAAALESAERELAKVRFCPYCGTGFIPNPGDEHKDSCPGCARAEKAEHVLGEMRDALTNIAGYGISPNDGYPVVSADVVKVARAALRPSEDTE